jgi:phage tail sheath protein FI
MPTYQHPGVYLEEIPSGVKPIEGVATSVAVFVGEAARGPVGEPVLVHSLDAYAAVYGSTASEADAMGLAVSAFYLNGGRSTYVMRVTDGRPGNSAAASVAIDGEDAARVLTISARDEGAWGNQLHYRVKKSSPTDPKFVLEIGRMERRNNVLTFRVDERYADLSMSPLDPNYVLTAVNGSSRLVKVAMGDVAAALQPGTLAGSNKLGAEPVYFKTNLDSDKTLSINLDGLGARQIVISPGALPLGGTDNTKDGQAVAAAIQAAVRAISPKEEPYKSFTAAYAGGQFTLSSPASAAASIVVYDDEGDPKSLAKILGLDPKNAKLTAGAAKIVPKAVPTAKAGVEALPLNGGKAGAPQQADYRAAFERLKKVREISVVVLPGQSLAANGQGNPAVTEALSHCAAVGNRMVIIDPPPGVELNDAGKVEALQLPTSNYATCYYPWVKVPNPFYSAETNPKATLLVAPSAFAAGMWSRIDGTRGVWKAPAGVEASLLGVAGLEHLVEDGEQDQLNPRGVNCLRQMPSFGPVIWGARTLATRVEPEWRYVSVRRTALMIEQSIYNGIQWAVFEPNEQRLWSSLRTNVGAFMDGLFRAGAFQGDKASDAFFVRCGLGDTMTQADIDRGQVIVIVGFAPVKPAEFVIVRIQQKVQQ